jgi:protoporphyrinogen oxidase
MDVQVFAVRGGMSALAGKIASSIRDRGGVIRTGCSIATLQQRNGQWHVVTRDGDGADYDNIVMATPPGEAARLVKGIAVLDSLHEWLEASHTRSAATISITVAGTMRAQWFGLSFPRGDGPGERMAALTLQQNKPAELVPAGTSAINIFPALPVVDRVREMDAAGALNFLKPSLERVFPGITQRISGVRVNAGDMQYRSMAPGFVRRIQQLQELKMPEGFALAGDYTTVPTVEGAVRSGERAAAMFSA